MSKAREQLEKHPEQYQNDYGDMCFCDLYYLAERLLDAIEQAVEELTIADDLETEPEDAWLHVHGGLGVLERALEGKAVGR